MNTSDVQNTDVNAQAERLSNEGRPCRPIVHVEGPDGRRFDSKQTRLWIACNSVCGVSYHYQGTGTIKPSLCTEAFGNGRGYGLLVMDEAEQVLGRYPAGETYRYERIGDVVKISEMADDAITTQGRAGQAPSLKGLSFAGSRSL